MSYRMSEEDWNEVMACSSADHRIARMIAEENSWGWAACWFADTGEFGHGLMKSTPTYADNMIRHLFTWWQGIGRKVTEREQHAENLMAAYLREREEAGDVGPVDHFAQLWPNR
jgi:hypothetical protein